METKHTKGEWTINPVIEKNEFGVNEIGIDALEANATNICSIFYNDELESKIEAESTAKLIAEAGTITNQCGFTPKQLLEQRNDLLEALIWAKEQFKILQDKGLYPEHLLQQNGGNGIMPIVNAINKATK